MQSNQQAYDRGSTIFSPDGRLYQVEYAREAVKRGSAVVGVTTRSTVVFAATRQARSPLLDQESIEKLHDIDGHHGIATAGHVADGHHLVDFARQFAQRDRLRYGEKSGVEPVVTAVADYIQESTQTGGTRPFGVALLVAGVDASGPTLYQLDPSGAPTAWDGTAIGEDSDAIRSYLEDTYERDLDPPAGLELAVAALAEQNEELTASGIEVASMDESGFDSFDREQREQLLAEVDVSTGS